MNTNIHAMLTII